MGVEEPKGSQGKKMLFARKAGGAIWESKRPGEAPLSFSHPAYHSGETRSRKQREALSRDQAGWPPLSCVSSGSSTLLSCLKAPWPLVRKSQIPRQPCDMLNMLQV